MLKIIDLKNDILSKLEQTRDILNKASELGLTQDFKQRYADYAQDVEQQRDRVRNLDLRMGIVAPMSTGKSTIINAIVSQELLPVSATAMTSICTEIVFNSELSEPILTVSPEFVRFFHDLTIGLQNKIGLLGEAGIRQLMGSHPHLEKLRNDIQFDPQTILEKINQTRTGINDIGQTLYYINHIIRLATIIDKPNEPQLIQQLNLLPIPRINTSYTQDYLNQNCQTIGNLIIIDTPGPSEVDIEGILIEGIWNIVLPILRSCSAILVVLDFTKLNDDSAEKVKSQVKQLSRFMGEDNLYVLVNKIDQRMPDDPMTSENIKSLVFNEFGVKQQENIEKVFEISGRQAFSAAKYLYERRNSPNSQKSDLKTVKELASQVFAPITWEEDLEECTLPALDRKAGRLWEKSGFTPFLEQVINSLLANGAPIVFKGALNNSYNRLLEVKNNFDIILSTLDRDKERITKEIQSLEGDIELIKTKNELWQRKVVEILKDHWLIGKTSIIDDLVSTQKSIGNEVKDIFNKIVKHNKFGSKMEVENISFQVSQQVQNHINLKLNPILDRMDALIKDVNSRLLKATDNYLKPQEISQDIQKRLHKNLDVIVIFNFDKFIPTITIDNTKLKIDDIKVYVSLFGALHNAFTSPLRRLDIDIPIVDEQYQINCNTYIRQVQKTIQEGIDSLTIEFKEIAETIPREAEEYAQKLQNQILSFQRNMEEAIILKAQEAMRCEPLKKDFSFLSARANELLTEIDELRQESEKLL